MHDMQGSLYHLGRAPPPFQTGSHYAGLVNLELTKDPVCLIKMYVCILCVAYAKMFTAAKKKKK